MRIRTFLEKAAAAAGILVRKPPARRVPIPIESRPGLRGKVRKKDRRRRGI